MMQRTLESNIIQNQLKTSKIMNNNWQQNICSCNSQYKWIINQYKAISHFSELDKNQTFEGCYTKKCFRQLNCFVRKCELCNDQIIVSLELIGENISNFGLIGLQIALNQKKSKLCLADLQQYFNFLEVHVETQEICNQLICGPKL